MIDQEHIVNHIIPEKIREIEEREQIRILHCVESGSRAWGFASPDSDFDVRFIYVRKPEYYLRLEPTKDVINWQLDDTLDINGWDLQKALRLMFNSNPTMFEWCKSPIVYKTTPEWAEISSGFGSYFRSRAGMHHYLSTAKRNYKDHLMGDTVKPKKYFYVLRPLLACRWIVKNQTPPPMLFTDLMDACLEEEMVPVVNDLLQLKMHTPEMGKIQPIQTLQDYLQATIQEMDKVILSLPWEDAPSWDVLDRIFLHILFPHGI